MLMAHILKPKILILLIIALCIGILVGILVPMFIGGGGSAITLGDRLLLTGNPQTPGINIPISITSSAGFI